MQKSTSRRRLGTIAGSLLAAVVFLSPLPAVAHHGWGGYLDDEFEITGTAESPVSVAGAHASMKVRVDGNVWDVVMAPPARTQAAGLKSGMIPAGAKVTVHGHRHRDPQRFEIKTERVTWNGREYAVYPDRD